MLRFIDQEEAPEPQAQRLQAAPAAVPAPIQAKAPAADPLASLALPARPRGLEALAITPFDTGAMEQDLGEQAGLQGLPSDRMHRQAGRPLFNNPAPVGTPERAAQAARSMRRNKRNREVELNWDPLEMEFRQKKNNWNDNPRSRTVAPSLQSLDKAVRDYIRPGWTAIMEENVRAGAPAADFSRKWDISNFIDWKTEAAIKGQLFMLFDSTQHGDWRPMNKHSLPPAMRDYLPKLSNDLLYEYNANLKKRRAEYLRNNTVDMIQMSRDAIKPISPLPGRMTPNRPNGLGI